MPNLLGVSGTKDPSVFSYSYVVIVSPFATTTYDVSSTNPWLLNV